MTGRHMRYTGTTLVDVSTYELHQMQDFNYKFNDNPISVHAKHVRPLNGIQNLPFLSQKVKKDQTPTSSYGCTIKKGGRRGRAPSNPQTHGHISNTKYHIGKCQQLRNFGQNFLSNKKGMLTILSTPKDLINTKARKIFSLLSNVNQRSSTDLTVSTNCNSIYLNTHSIETELSHISCAASMHIQ